MQVPPSQSLQELQTIKQGTTMEYVTRGVYGHLGALGRLGGWGERRLGLVREDFLGKVTV